MPVVKHGNRSVSSRSGSADVLASLGVHVEGDAEFARACLRETNLAFCFAPAFHPALKHVGPVRRKLGVPTIFNCVGPLANPAGAKHQLLGVGRLDLLDRMAGALAKLGGAHAILVCSQDGLDEVSLSAPTQVRVVRDEEIRSFVWTPDDFDLEPVKLTDLVVADAAESAAVVARVLAGKEGQPYRVVLANAAAALFAVGRANNLRDGVAQAREAIRSGKANEVLENWRQLTPGQSRG
ncbi:MAG: anthranilate phosphoribosyltransferase [Gemmataceae bacterium]